MVEQVKSVDYISRRIRFFERAECEGLNVLDACIYQNAY